MAASAYFQTVQKIYIAFYQRPADPEGLKFWANEIDLAGGKLDAAIAAFGTAPESQELYGDIDETTIESVIDSIYMAAFGRDTSDDPDGLAYWVGEFTAGRVTASGIALAVVMGAQNEDLAVITNKLVVANEFTAQVDGRDLTDPAFGTAPFAVTYAGNGDADAARVILKPVTGDTATILTPAQITEQIKATIADPSDPINSATQALTTGVDTLVGGVAGDVFTGVVSALSAENTLNATDSIDGGAGTDTLKVDLNSNFTGFTGTGKLANVENIDLTNTSTIARTFDATGVTGAQQYTIDAAKAGISLTNLAGTAAVSVSNQAAGTFTTAFAAGAAELLGTADAMTLKLAGMGKVDDVATVANEEVAVGITLNNIETANVNVTGDNVVNFGGTALKSLNIAGAGNVKVTVVPTSLTSFDASAATGNVTADVTATAAQLTKVATGAGNDKLTFDAADAAANATLSGGAGTDELTLNSAAAAAKTVQYTMSGFETLNLGAVNTSPLTFSGTNVTDLATVTTKSTVTAAVSLVNMGAGALAVKALGATVAGGALSSDHAGATTLGYVADKASVTAKTVQTTKAGFTFANTSALTVNVGEYIDTTASDVIAAKATNVTLNVASGKDGSATPAEVTVFNSKITAAKATSITVNALGQLGSAATIDAAVATGAAVTNGSTAGTLTLTTEKLENLNVTTGAALEFLAASKLGALQTLSVNAGAGETELGGLTKVANVTLSGAGTTLGKESKVTLGALGANTNDYSLTLNATGLKGGLTTTGLNSKAGYDVTANVAGVTGNVALGTVVVGANATITANGVGGTVTVGAIGDATATTGNISVAAKSVVGAVTVGAIGTKGNISVDANGAVGKVIVGALTGNNVTLDVANTIGGFAGNAGTVGTLDKITAKTSATVNFSNLQANTLAIDADAASTALTVALKGGILDDVVTITGAATNTSIIVSGDLGLGANKVTLTAAASTAAATIDASGLKGDAGASAYLTEITGGTAADVIKGSAGADLIHVGVAGAKVTGGAGNDQFDVKLAVATATPVVTTITDFTKGDTLMMASGTALAVVDLSGLAAGKTDAEVFTAVAAGAAGTTVAWAVYNGNTYVLNEVADGVTVDATDIAVKLVGGLDLSTSTITAGVVTFA